VSCDTKLNGSCHTRYKPFLTLCSRTSSAGTALNSFLHYTHRSHRRRGQRRDRITKMQGDTYICTTLTLMHFFRLIPLLHQTTLTLFYTLRGGPDFTGYYSLLNLALISRVRGTIFPLYHKPLCVCTGTVTYPSLYVARFATPCFASYFTWDNTFA